MTNTSVNPARSTSQALFVGGWTLSRLWMFWVAPIVGATLAGGVYRDKSGSLPTGKPPQKSRGSGAYLEDTSKRSPMRRLCSQVFER